MQICELLNLKLMSVDSGTQLVYRGPTIADFVHY